LKLRLFARNTLQLSLHYMFANVDLTSIKAWNTSVVVP
jgi:hypothetical protein